MTSLDLDVKKSCLEDTSMAGATTSVCEMSEGIVDSLRSGSAGRIWTQAPIFTITHEKPPVGHSEGVDFCSAVGSHTAAVKAASPENKFNGCMTADQHDVRCANMQDREDDD